MHSLKKLFFLGIAFLGTNEIQSQVDPVTLGEFSNLIKDAIFFTDKYVTPATDAAVYQAASAWMYTPKKSELWDFTIGLHYNTFFVPNRDRKFSISNNQLSFFQIQEAETALTPTALGNREYVTLKGSLGGSDVELKTPEGINMQTVMYPYLQMSLGLWKGTDLVVKYAPEINLKNVDYQVYGFGFKHNLSQYFELFQKQNFNLSALVVYSKEDLTVNFLDIETKYGNFGFTRLNSQINTYQFQLNGSKEYKNLEIAAGLIANTSSFEYFVAGKKGEVENILPLRSLINEQLVGIGKNKFNCIGEVSLRYKMSHFYLQPTVAFGKFINTNISLQYQL